MKQETFKINDLPSQVGEYSICNWLVFTFPKKPNWFHRTMTRIFFGWVWKDYKKRGEK